MKRLKCNKTRIFWVEKMYREDMHRETDIDGEDKEKPWLNLLTKEEEGKRKEGEERQESKIGDNR